MTAFLLSRFYPAYIQLRRGKTNKIEVDAVALCMQIFKLGKLRWVTHDRLKAKRLLLFNKLPSQKCSN